MKNLLKKFHACKEGIEFVSKFPSLKEAWNKCDRGDWMLWLAYKLHVDTRRLFLAKGLCANTIRHLMKSPASLAAVDAAISFGKGEIESIPKEIVDAADSAAYSAAAYAAASAYAAAYSAAAYSAAAYSAASSASSAAYSASSAAYSAADSAAASASSAAYSAADSAADSARKKNRKETSDICREILTEEVFSKLDQIEKE